MWKKRAIHARNSNRWIMVVQRAFRLGVTNKGGGGREQENEDRSRTGKLEGHRRKISATTMRTLSRIVRVSLP